MTSQDFLYYALGFGFLVLVGFLSLAAYRMSESLQRLTQILQNAEDISEDISSDIGKLKNGIRLALLNLLQLFIKKRR